MKQILTFAFIGTSMLCSKFTNAQGCSDAGFCSLRYHIKSAKNKAKENSIAIGNVFGQADLDVAVNNTYLNANIKLKNDLFLDAKIATQSASGNLGSNFGLGDFTATLQYGAMADEDNKTSLSFGGGLKIPLNNANAKNAGKALPMHYQSSLGTTDLLLGVNYIKSKWEFITGLQIPISGNNSNTFLKTTAAESKYFNTNKFKRQGDFIAKASYQTKAGVKVFSLKTTLTCIYHLAKDSYVNSANQTISIGGSSGPNVNVLFSGIYDFDEVNSLKAILSTPSFIVNNRADGLRRNFAIGLEFKRSF